MSSYVVIPLCPLCNSDQSRPIGYARDKIRRRYYCISCLRTFHTEYKNPIPPKIFLENEILEKILKGQTYKQICLELKVSSKTIAKIVSDHKLRKTKF